MTQVSTRVFIWSGHDIGDGYHEGTIILRGMDLDSVRRFVRRQRTAQRKLEAQYGALLRQVVELEDRTHAATSVDEAESLTAEVQQARATLKALPSRFGWASDEKTLKTILERDPDKVVDGVLPAMVHLDSGGCC